MQFAPANTSSQQEPAQQQQQLPDQTYLGGGFHPNGLVSAYPIIGNGYNPIKPAAGLFGMPTGEQGPMGNAGGMGGMGGGSMFGGGPMGPMGPMGGMPPGQFIPNQLSDPFTQGISAGNNMASYASQAAPGAALFHAGMYDPTMNALESSFLGSSANLGRTQLLQAFANAGNTLNLGFNQGQNQLWGGFNQGNQLLDTGMRQGTQMLNHATNQGRLGLQDAFNRIDAQYVNSPFHTSRGRQMDDAANVFAENQMNTGAQLGIQQAGQAGQLGQQQSTLANQLSLQQGSQAEQLANNMAGMGMQFGNNIVNQGANLALERQRMAAQSLPFTFGFPTQVATANQQAAAGMYNLGQQAMYGDTQFPMAVHGQIPQVAPTVVQPPPSSGGRRGKK